MALADPSRAIIFHGSGGHPDAVWYGWLGERLRARGFNVELPHYPGLNREPIATYFVNSVHDPYGCEAGQGRAMFDRLGGTLIVRDEGHFGDVDDPYPTFELLDRLIA